MSAARVTRAMLVVLLAAAACAAHAQPFGRGRGRGGPPGDAQFAADRELFHYLLTNRDKIVREIKNLPEGVETLTESRDKQVAAAILRHVKSMYARMESERPIHRRDPLFDVLFRNADKITAKVERTDQGVRVRATSKDPYVAKLIQEHAKVVSLFLKNGPAEVRRNHPLPKK